MQASHQSLRDDYEVSTPELDRIVDIAMTAGAAGARLTGAGLGGAVLILCAGHTEEGIRESLAAGYYSPRGVSLSEDVLFRAVPSDRATVTRLD
jgi:galactokinase